MGSIDIDTLYKILSFHEKFNDNLYLFTIYIPQIKTGKLNIQNSGFLFFPTNTCAPLHF